eukprot:1158001-Pelagomonas_calceolata.AAC.1
MVARLGSPIKDPVSSLGFNHSLPKLGNFLDSPNFAPGLAPNHCWSGKPGGAFLRSHPGKNFACFLAPYPGNLPAQSEYAGLLIPA